MFACVHIISNFGKNAFAVIASLFQFLRENKDAAAALESLAKIAALVVAGWWTWQTYIRKRVKFPSGKVEHVISHWEDAGVKFLRVTLRMTNTGNVLIPIAEGCTWIQQVTPVPTEIYDAVSTGKDPVQAGTTEVDWTMLQERKLNSPTKYEIEPGETEEFHFDFTIPKSVSRVLIYSHVENPKKRGWFGREKIGWNLSTVCEIPSVRKGFREWLSHNL
jgi:hypothetical protein